MSDGSNGEFSEELTKYASLFFDTSYDSILITTADVDNHVIVYANNAFSKMSGYSREEVLGKRPSFLQGEKTNRQVMQRLKECLRTDKPFEGSAINYRKDGTEYYVQWKVHALKDVEGEQVYFMAIQRDLSVLKASLNRLKVTNHNFRDFIQGLGSEEATQTIERAVVVNAKKAYTEDLIKNEQHVELFEEDKADDLDDDDLFEFEEASFVEYHDQNAETMSARVYIEANTPDEGEVLRMEALINDLDINLGAYSRASDKEATHASIVEDMRELGNTVFYFDDFIEISSALHDLTTALSHVSPDQMNDIVLSINIELIQDLRNWMKEVFEEQSADDIHFSDNSIISSCKQIVMFLKG